MNKRTYWTVIPAALALILTGAGVAHSEAPVIEVGQKLSADPLTAKGTSGGKNSSNCGYISPAPNQVVKVTAAQVNYLRVSVQSSGQPTLLIEGPNGRFCVLADNSAGEKPELSGVWVEGIYSIYVGDRLGEQHPYTLSITQKAKQP